MARGRPMKPTGDGTSAQAQARKAGRSSGHLAAGGHAVVSNASVSIIECELAGMENSTWEEKEIYQGMYLSTQTSPSTPTNPG